MSAQKITVTLYGDGMGGDANESDFDSFASFVTDRIDERTGLDVTVEQARWGEAGETCVRGLDDSERAADVKNAVQDLWDEWCAAGVQS